MLPRSLHALLIALFAVVQLVGQPLASTSCGALTGDADRCCCAAGSSADAGGALCGGCCGGGAQDESHPGSGSEGDPLATGCRCALATPVFPPAPSHEWVLEQLEVATARASLVPGSVPMGLWPSLEAGRCAMRERPPAPGRDPTPVAERRVRHDVTQVFRL